MSEASTDTPDTGANHTAVRHLPRHPNVAGAGTAATATGSLTLTSAQPEGGLTVESIHHRPGAVTRPTRSDRERVALALSILNHRQHLFCPWCLDIAEQVRLALMGAEITDLLPGVVS